MEDNVIDIYGYIDSVSMDDNIVSPQHISKQLKKMQDAGNITVNINSNGGDVFSGIAIYNMLKKHPAHITVNIDGIAASIASVIAMAGDQINMPGNAVMMIHNAWSVMEGDSKKMKKQAENLERINDLIFNSYLSRKLEMDKKELQSMMDEETWMTAREAKKYGFIDKVVADSKAAATINGIFWGGEMMRKYRNFRNEEEEPETDREPTAEDVVEMLQEILDTVKDIKDKMDGEEDNEEEEKDEEGAQNSFARLFNSMK